MTRLPWRNHTPPAEQPINHTDRLPDGDTVVPPGGKRWVDLLRDAGGLIDTDAEDDEPGAPTRRRGSTYS